MRNDQIASIGFLLAGITLAIAERDGKRNKCNSREILIVDVERDRVFFDAACLAVQMFISGAAKLLRRGLSVAGG